MFAKTTLSVLIGLVLAWSVLTRASDGAGPGTAYRVEPGDTLWSIAEARYGGDPRQAVWEIQRKNGLGAATVVPGQMLLLP